MKVNLSSTAYIKIVLHAAKYPSYCIGGFLISASSSPEPLDIFDIVPVFHNAPTGPIMDISATLTDFVHAAPHTIIGFYFANDRIDCVSTPMFINKICKGIQAANGSCLLIQLRNASLKDKDSLCLSATAADGHVAELITIDSPKQLNKMCDTLIGNKVHRTLIDIEDHMDNAPGDILNSAVDRAVNSLA